MQYIETFSSGVISSIGVTSSALLILLMISSFNGLCVKCVLSHFYVEVYKLWNSDVVLPNAFPHRHNKWFTKLIVQTSLFYQHASLSSLRENVHCAILHYVCTGKFFGVFADPILLTIVTNQSVVFVTVVIFWMLYYFLMDIYLSIEVVCLLFMRFGICGNYWIGKNHNFYGRYFLYLQ